MRKSSDAQIRAAIKYDKNNTRLIQLKLNKKTDADILEYLDQLDNRQGYIKELIRKDMNGGLAPEEPQKKILDGDFLEGEKVTVLINGEKHTRKVKYSKKWGDLIITVLGIEHAKYEFK